MEKLRLNEEQRKALEIIAEMVFPIGAYDDVDGTMEIRLHGEAHEILCNIFKRKWDERRKSRQV